MCAESARYPSWPCTSRTAAPLSSANGVGGCALARASSAAPASCAAVPGPPRWARRISRSRIEVAASTWWMNRPPFCSHIALRSALCRGAWTRVTLRHAPFNRYSRQTIASTITHGGDKTMLRLMSYNKADNIARIKYAMKHLGITHNDLK